jgi:gluconolactonase
MKRILIIILVLQAFTLIAQEISQDEFIKVVDNLKFPEGPAWDGRNFLYVSNCYGNWITRISPDKCDSFVVAPTTPVSFEKTNGLVYNKDNFIYACDYGKGAIIKFNKHGECKFVSDGYKGKKFNRPNDLAFDKNGNLYFTDPKSYDKNIPDGVVYRISKKNKKVSVAYSGLCFPNGIAFSKDGKYLFVCESAKERVLKFTVKKDGTLKDPAEFIHLPGGDPDGIAFDVDGNLYIAHFGGQAIVVVKPDGSIKEKIKTPGKKPSNVEFAGKELKTLYITEDETNAVYKKEVGVAGLKLFSLP